MTTPVEIDNDPGGGPYTYYVLHDDGSLSGIASTVAGEPELTTPGKLVTVEEYEQRLEEARTAREEYRAQVLAEDERSTKADYDALVGLGLPDETARRMSGYTGE